MKTTEATPGCRFVIWNKLKHADGAWEKNSSTIKIISERVSHLLTSQDLII